MVNVTAWGRFFLPVERESSSLKVPLMEVIQNLIKEQMLNGKGLPMAPVLLFWGPRDEPNSSSGNKHDMRDTIS